MTTAFWQKFPTIGANKSVDFCDVNFVKLLHRFLNLGFVGLLRTEAVTFKFRKLKEPIGRSTYVPDSVNEAPPNPETVQPHHNPNGKW